ncbi:hypothetical protein V6N11_079368 [Hibiscus sabdariffa]|uniref:Uncharacterized protein n=1 Tax=Hibiscus sabdariffa TaxID=183260 RepID=A0ABR2RV72_9ROSI
MHAVEVDGSEDSGSWLPVVGWKNDADGKNDVATNQALEDIRNMGLRVDMANGNTKAYAIESEAELK